MINYFPLQVACEIIEMIVPAVLETNLSIVNTFFEASDDLPSHRYREVLYRLVNCLGRRWVSFSQCSAF